MAYTFKKLAEVEEIQEVPETARAFVEVDGEVKRAPYGAGGGAGAGAGAGGAKIDDLRFDLDVEEVVEMYTTYINFTNMDQIKKVWDNDMNIVILYRKSDCCGITANYREYLRCKTTAKLSGVNAVIPSQGMEGSYTSGGYDDYKEAITVTFETGERLTPVSAKYRKNNSGNEILSAYATI